MFVVTGNLTCQRCFRHLQILFELCVSEDPVSASVVADSNIVRALVGIARQQVGACASAELELLLRFDVSLSHLEPGWPLRQLWLRFKCSLSVSRCQVQINEVLELPTSILSSAVNGEAESLDGAAIALASKKVDAARKSSAALLGLSRTDNPEVIDTLAEAGLPTVLMTAVQCNDNVLRSLALLALLALLNWVRGWLILMPTAVTAISSSASL